MNDCSTTAVQLDPIPADGCVAFRALTREALERAEREPDQPGTELVVTPFLDADFVETLGCGAAVLAEAFLDTWRESSEVDGLADVLLVFAVLAPVQCVVLFLCLA